MNLGVRVIESMVRLPIPGSNTNGLAALAWLVVAAGLVAVVLGRRRRVSEEWILGSLASWVRAPALCLAPQVARSFPMGELIEA